MLIYGFRGNGRDKSVVGVIKCDPGDHGLVAAIIIGCLILMFIGALLNRRDQRVKKELGYTFVTGDVDWTWHSIFKLAFIGFMGGFISAGFGLGAALIFNPTLMGLAIHPAVASDTGMYLSMVGSTASTFIVIMFGRFNPYYAIVLSVMTLIGSYPGLITQKWLVVKTGKPSTTVALLLMFIIFCLLANPILSIINIFQMSKAGADVLKMGTYC
jgi:hypothetical protein